MGFAWGLSVVWRIWCIWKKADIRLRWDLNPGPLLFVHDRITHWGRVLTLFDLVEPEGTERGCSWPFVPFLDKNRLGPSRILGLVNQISMNDNLLRMPRNSNSVSCAKCVHLHLLWCQSPSNNTLFVPVRLDRSVLLKNKKGSNTCFPVPRKLFFSGCTGSVRCRQPISTNESGK